MSAPVGDGGPSVTRFEPDPQSVRRARELVTERAEAWGDGELAAAAALAVTELAANAVLHARGPYIVMVRPLGRGLRVDVVDERPQDLPMVVPRHGVAADITQQAATGRGLQIVASLASRWGFSSTDDAKSVWVELQPGEDTPPTDPVVSLAPLAVPSDASPVVLDLRQLPVRAAVASGMELEGMVRLLLLDHRRAVDDAAMERLHELLDASAQPRLQGRHAALRAASLGQHEFDLWMRTTREALGAIPVLTGHILDVAERAGIPMPAVSDEVAAFRTWLGEETRRQLDGERPSPYPLP